MKRQVHANMHIITIFCNVNFWIPQWDTCFMFEATCVPLKSSESWFICNKMSDDVLLNFHPSSIQVRGVVSLTHTQVYPHSAHTDCRCAHPSFTWPPTSIPPTHTINFQATSSPTVPHKHLLFLSLKDRTQLSDCYQTFNSLTVNMNVSVW